MSITNHGAVGALIAIAIKQPLLALPLAFLSHFVLDALPHFGFKGNDGFREAFKHRITYIEEGFSLPAFVVLMILLIPFGWIAYAGAIAAISPDIVWAIRYLFFERYNKPPKPNGPFVRFHQRIQWGE